MLGGAEDDETNVRSVLILGAGCSLGEAGGYRPQRTLEHPPLDTNFFEKAIDLAQSSPAVRTSVRTLTSRVSTSSRFYDPFRQPTTSLEQYFADVYYEVAGGRSSQAFQVFVALLRLYAGVLAATTNWMASHGRGPGLIGKLLRHEMGLSKGDRVTVITFNHDLVIENEVRRLPRVHGTWCLSGLYGDPEMDRLRAPSGTPRFPHHSDGCRHEAPIELLKLHGSLNWVVRQVARDPKMSTLFPTSSRRRAMFITDRRETGVTGEIKIRGQRRPWYGFPVIVPPIYDKQSITGTGLFQAVWNKASSAIERAEKLLLVGYSLPDADVVARQMLRRAFARSELNAVDCVNPDPAMAAKLRSALDVPVIRLYRALESYLQVDSAP